MQHMDSKYLAWREVVKTYTRENLQDIYQKYLEIFHNEPVPIAWMPGNEEIKDTNIAKSLSELNLDDYHQLFQWAAKNRDEFWEYVIKKLNIKFTVKYEEVLSLKNGIENPEWFRGASLNIIESCLQGKAEQTAITEGREGSQQLMKITYQELKERVERMAGGLVDFGLRPGDNVVIYAPLTSEAIICYLALIKIGAIPVSVADSFSPAELRKRVEISKPKAVVTISTYLYDGKKLMIYEKVKEASELPTIVFGDQAETQLRNKDILYDNLLNSKAFSGYHYSESNATINILFSSGTTKEPKAIPFTQITPVKCASDGYFHQDIKSKDTVTWTTSMGWMMAPWLIFASLLNRASISIYVGSAASQGFNKFITDSKTTILGTIPSVVKAWKKQEFHKKVDWMVRVFSSTGEPSNMEDFFYLMSLAGFRAPVIEYCGGTELGGGYIAGTIVRPSSPGLFTTPTLGLDFYLLKSDGSETEDREIGEVFIIPPSVGMTQRLLNRDNHDEYYKGTPKGLKGEVLRRHGDAFEKIIYNGVYFYRSYGRTDDTMNLGGIKVSAVEIENTLNNHQAVFETAAVSVAEDGGGPEGLVVFVVPRKEIIDAEELKKDLQGLIKNQLNPLFKIAYIKLIDQLPRTASNKVMRRSLRHLV